MPQVYIQFAAMLLLFLLQPVSHNNPAGKASLKSLGALVDIQ